MSQKLIPSGCRTYNALQCFTMPHNTHLSEYIYLSKVSEFFLARAPIGCCIPRDVLNIQ